MSFWDASKKGNFRDDHNTIISLWRLYRLRYIYGVVDALYIEKNKLTVMRLPRKSRRSFAAQPATLRENIARPIEAINPFQNVNAVDDDVPMVRDPRERRLTKST